MDRYGSNKGYIKTANRMISLNFSQYLQIKQIITYYKFQYQSIQSFKMQFQELRQQSSQRRSTNNVLQSKDMNSQILQTIKKAREKLSVEISSKLEHHDSSQFFSGSARNISNNIKLRDSNSSIDKTINILKNRISELEKQNERLQEREKIVKQQAQIEIEGLKIQLSRFVQKELQKSLQKNNGETTLQFEQFTDKIRRGDLELQVMRSKLINFEQKYSCLQKSYKALQKKYAQLEQEKQKHIELNIADKIKFEEQITILNGDREKKVNQLNKIQQQNINLKREIHGIFNKDRMNKQTNPLLKKTQEEYEFEIKELTQKFTIKIKGQQKQLVLLKKTLQQMKQKTNQSQYHKLAEYERELDQKKEKIIQREKKIVAKNIEIQRLTSKIQNLNQVIKQMETQNKQLQQSLNKKELNQQDLTNKLAKNGVAYKQSTKDYLLSNTTPIKKGDLKNNIQFQSKQIILDDTSFEAVALQQSKFCKTVQLQKSGVKEIKSARNSIQKSVIDDIVIEERALAGLKSSYKKVDSKNMSLNQIMRQIRRKSDKINDLRSQKKE